MPDYGASDTSTTSLGAGQFPISDVYVPSTGLKALGGGPVANDGTHDYAPAYTNLMYIGSTAISVFTPADAASNPTTLLGVESFPMLYNGSTWDRQLGYKGANVSMDRIRYLISQGKGFRAVAPQVATGTGAANFIGFLMRANNLSVDVWVYRIVCISDTNFYDGRMYYNTTGANTDSGLTVNLLTSNTTNQKVGGSASALTSLSGSPASTTEASGMGGTGAIQVGLFGAGVQPMNEVLADKSVVWLPKSTDTNFSCYVQVTTTAKHVGYMIEWVEF